jgi:hypothetical protein
MLLRSMLGNKVFGALVALGLFSVSAAGCGGCNESTLQCDNITNQCQICDAYGCHNANVTGSGGGFSSSSSSSSTGSTSSSTGAGGAKPTCDQATEACPCATPAECNSGKQCIDGLCIVGCDFDYQCGAGNVCANGKCEVGCDAQTPCALGYTCDKGACVPDPANPQCGPNKPCEGKELCVDGFCSKPCLANADCGAGKICDGQSGACIPDPSPQVGCSANMPCTGQGQQCGADGYCHYPCNDVNACKLIDNRFAACDQSVCKTQEEVNPECTLNMPCPSGKDCISNHCK